MTFGRHSLYLLGLFAAAYARGLPDDDSEIGAYRSGSCRFDVNEDLPKKFEPLLLARGDSGYSLILPEVQGKAGVITLNEEEEMIIACPGKSNFIETTKEVTNRASCKSGSTLSVDGRNWKFLQLDCHGRPQAASKVTRRTCANGKGRIVELGFEVYGWNKMMEVCHDIARSSTYYSMHILYGARLAGKVYRKTERPKFARGDYPLFQGAQPEIAYTQKNQLAVFKQILDKNTTSFINSRKYSLSRGHLSPDADFLLSPHQFSTYFYVNVAPQWQSINAGNWYTIEQTTRRIAKKLQVDLVVVTGTLGVLRLPGKEGESEITLQNSRIPVPEFFWKVLRSTQDNSCIVFIASNNPFLTQKPRHICQDICSVNRWPVLQSDFSRGYIYCCDYSQVKRAIPEMPNLRCRSTLRG